MNSGPVHLRAVPLLGRGRRSADRSSCVVLSLGIRAIAQTAYRGGVLPLEFQAQPGPGQVGPQRAADRASARRRRAGARSGRGRGSTPGGGSSAAQQPGARAATARNGPRAAADAPRTARRPARKPVIPPQRVASAWSTSTAPGLEHPAEVEQVVAVLAGGDVHAGRGAVAEQPQAVEVVGGDRLLEPGHAQLGESLGHGQGLLAAVGAVGVDEQLGVGPDRLAGGPDAAEVVLRVACRSSSSPAGCPRATQPPSWSRSCSIEYDVNPPLP